MLADAMAEPVINILVKSWSIDSVIDTFTGSLANALDAAIVDGDEIFDGDLLIPVGAAMIASGFVVSLSYSVDVLPGTWAGPVVKSIGARVEAVAGVINIRVFSGIGVDMSTGVDANVL